LVKNRPFEDLLVTNVTGIVF